MRNMFLAVVVVLFPALSSAQQIPGNVLIDLAKDLTALQAQVDAISRAQTRRNLPSIPGLYFSVTTDNAQIWAGASEKTKGLGRVSVGQLLQVLDRTNEWYAVEYKNPGSDSPFHGWIKATQGVPISQVTVKEWPGGIAVGQQSQSTPDLYQVLITQVGTIREKWKDNKYVSVKGFSVSVSVPPSVSLSFEFK